MANRLLVSIVGDNRQLQKTLADTEKRLKKQNAVFLDVAGKMASAGKKMTLAATLPILGIGTAASKMAMDAVESENLFEVSMGRMADAAREWSNELSKSLGLNQYEVRKTVSTFNVMFDSMGIGEQSAFNMSKGLTQLSYDMASFYNLNPEEAFQKLQAGITGEIEPLKRLGIIVNETTIKQYAWKNGIAETGAELTEQEKVMARYGSIMEQTSKAQGDLARTMESPTNQLRILKAQATEAAISFGTLLLPTVQKLLETGNEWLSNLKDLSEEKKRMVINIGLIAAAIPPAIYIISKMTQGVIKLKDAIILMNTVRKGSLIGGAGLGAIGFGVIGGLVNLSGTIYGLTDTIKKMNAGVIDSKLAWLNLAYPMGAVLQKFDLFKTKESIVADLGMEIRKLNEQGLGDLNDTTDITALKMETAAKKQQLMTMSSDELTTALMAGEITLDEYNKAISEIEDESEDATEAIDELRKAFNELIEDLFGLTNAENAYEEATWAVEEAEKAMTEAIAEHGAEAREAKKAENELDSAIQERLKTLGELYINEGTSIERKQELRNELYKLLEQTKETSDLSQEKFLEMAEIFGLSATEIMIMAGNIGLELDEATKDRLIKLSIDGVEEVLKGADDVRRMLESIPSSISTSMAVNIIRQEQAMASGGIAGIPSASAGMITPAFDNGGILAMLHKNEVVLNSKQTKNLAELIFGLANTRPGISGGNGVSITNNFTTPKPLSESEITRQIDFLSRELGLRMGF